MSTFLAILSLSTLNRMQSAEYTLSLWSRGLRVVSWKRDGLEGPTIHKLYLLSGHPWFSLSAWQKFGSDPFQSTNPVNVLFFIWFCVRMSDCYRFDYSFIRFIHLVIFISLFSIWSLRKIIVFSTPFCPILIYCLFIVSVLYATIRLFPFLCIPILWSFPKYLLNPKGFFHFNALCLTV